MVEEVGGGHNKKVSTSVWSKTAKVSLGILGGLSLMMGYISAAGMRRSERESEARKAIDDYFAALNARDLESCRNTLHYPYIQMAASEVTVINESESFQVDFSLLASEGWKFTALDSCIMRQSYDDKVHFEVQFSVHNMDAPYETYQALWIVTKRDGVWATQFRSIIPTGTKAS